MAELRIALAQIDTCVGDDRPEHGADPRVDPARGGRGRRRRRRLPRDDAHGLPDRGPGAARVVPPRRAGAQRPTSPRSSPREGLGDLTVVLGHRGDRRDAGHGRARGLGGTGRPPTNRAVVLQHGEVLAALRQAPPAELRRLRRVPHLRARAPSRSSSRSRAARVGIVICEDIWQDGGPVTTLGGLDEAGHGSTCCSCSTGRPSRRARGTSAPSSPHGAPPRSTPRSRTSTWSAGRTTSCSTAGRSSSGPDGSVLTSSPQFVEDLLVWDLPARTPSTDGAGTAQETVYPTGRIAPPLDPDEEVYRACVTGLRGVRAQERIPVGRPGRSGRHRLRARRRPWPRTRSAGENVVGVSMPLDVLVRAQPGRRRRPGQAASAPTTASSRSRPWSTRSRASSRSRASPRRTSRHACAASSSWRSRTARATSSSRPGTSPSSRSATRPSTTRAASAATRRSRTSTSRACGPSRAGATTPRSTSGEIPPIPESSITKPPSAELRPGQIDQDSLPPYDLLDEVLDAYVEHAEGRAELLARGFDPEVVDKVADPRRPRRVEAPPVPARPQGHRAGLRPRPPPAHHDPLARAGRVARLAAEATHPTRFPNDRPTDHRRAARPGETRACPHTPSPARPRPRPPSASASTTSRKPRHGTRSSRCSPRTTR